MMKRRNALFGTRGTIAALAAGAMVLTSAPGMAASCNTQGNWRENTTGGDQNNMLTLSVRDQSTHDRWHGKQQQGTANEKEEFIGKKYLPLESAAYHGDLDATTLSLTVDQLNTNATIKCTVTVSNRTRWRDSFGKEKVNELRYDSYTCDTSKSKDVTATCTRNWNDTKSTMNVKFTLVDRPTPSPQLR
jgi:hypothetical protein